MRGGVVAHRVAKTPERKCRTCPRMAYGTRRLCRFCSARFTKQMKREREESHKTGVGFTRAQRRREEQEKARKEQPHG